MTSFYPPYPRSGSFCGDYCSMAMEAYYRVHRLVEKIREDDYCVTTFTELTEIKKQVICVVVFSAMSIEAFLNDYAAACLGDDEFYDYFDRLRPLEKLQLITKFILRTDIDKGKSYYSRLKELINKRNAFVHNKSKAAKFVGMSEEEWIQYQKKHCPELTDEQFDEYDYSDEIKYETNELLRDAQMPLKAIYDIACFFDDHDSGALAVNRLFHPIGADYGTNKERVYKAVVFPILGINSKDYYGGLKP